jgi:hypothetical protein
MLLFPLKPDAAHPQIAAIKRIFETQSGPVIVATEPGKIMAFEIDQHFRRCGWKKSTNDFYNAENVVI